MSDICHIDIKIETGDGSVFTLERTFTEFQEPLMIDAPRFDLPVFYEIHTIDGDLHWTNDEKGKYFNKPYFVDVIDDHGNEVDHSFKTETETVTFIHDTCPESIPDDLITLNSINDYCIEYSIDNLWELYVVSVCNQCTPTAVIIIQKLIDNILHGKDIQTHNSADDLSCLSFM